MLIVWVQSGGHCIGLYSTTLHFQLMHCLARKAPTTIFLIHQQIPEVAKRMRRLVPICLEPDRANLSPGCLILNDEEEVVPGSPAVWQDLLELLLRKRRGFLRTSRFHVLLNVFAY